MTYDILETTSRLVAWRINSLPQNYGDSLKSKVFFIGRWYWLLECFRFNEKVIFALTSLDIKSLPYLMASFDVHVFCSNGSLVIATKEYRDSILGQEFRYIVGESDISTLHATTPVTFSMEFLDLKIEVGNDKKIQSIWKEEYFSEHNATLEPMSRMLSESIYTDIVINASDGNVKAHRAILATNSPVFNAMFSENYIEKETSTINLTDMSIGACKAMLNFLYGKRDCDELQAHSMELILAADKYDIANLEGACETSLCEGVGANNVFEMLTCAHRYDLIDLKRTCLFYLLKMGMIFMLRDDYNSFLLEADRELIVEVSDACLVAWITN